MNMLNIVVATAGVIVFQIGAWAGVSATASYDVPNTTSQGSNLPVPCAKWLDPSPGQASLTFCLPEDLVGTDFSPIQFTETATAINPTERSLSGPWGSAQCDSSIEAQVTCKITYTYPNFTDVVPKVESFLSQKYSGSPSELALKEGIAVQFLKDPEGVLHMSTSAK